MAGHVDIVGAWPMFLHPKPGNDKDNVTLKRQELQSQILNPLTSKSKVFSLLVEVMSRDSRLGMRVSRN